MTYRGGERIGELDHLAGIDRVNEMFGVEIAVAEVVTQLDILGHGVAEAGKPLEHHGRRDVRIALEELAVPDHHLDADIPLDREVLMRDGAADRIELSEHRRLI